MHVKPKSLEKWTLDHWIPGAGILKSREMKFAQKACHSRPAQKNRQHKACCWTCSHSEFESGEASCDDQSNMIQCPLYLLSQQTVTGRFHTDNWMYDKQPICSIKGRQSSFPENQVTFSWGKKNTSRIKTHRWRIALQPSWRWRIFKCLLIFVCDGFSVCFCN